MDNNDDLNELEEITNNYTAPEHYEEWQKGHSKKITEALNRKNSIYGVMDLIAFHSTVSGYQGKKLLNIMSHIRTILFLTLIVLAFLAYKIS